MDNGGWGGYGGYGKGKGGKSGGGKGNAEHRSASSLARAAGRRRVAKGKGKTPTNPWVEAEFDCVFCAAHDNFGWRNTCRGCNWPRCEEGIAAKKARDWAALQNRGKPRAGGSFGGNPNDWSDWDSTAASAEAPWHAGGSSQRRPSRSAAKQWLHPGGAVRERERGKGGGKVITESGKMEELLYHTIAVNGEDDIVAPQLRRQIAEQKKKEAENAPESSAATRLAAAQRRKNDQEAWLTALEKKKEGMMEEIGKVEASIKAQKSAVAEIDKEISDISKEIAAGVVTEAVAPTATAAAPAAAPPANTQEVDAMVTRMAEICTMQAQMADPALSPEQKNAIFHTLTEKSNATGRELLEYRAQKQLTAAEEAKKQAELMKGQKTLAGMGFNKMGQSPAAAASSAGNSASATAVHTGAPTPQQHPAAPPEPAGGGMDTGDI